MSRSLKIGATPEPPKHPESPAGHHNGNLSDVRAIIDWFITVGQTIFRGDVQGEYVVRLLNILSYSLKLGRKFEVVTNVVMFFVEEGDTEEALSGFLFRPIFGILFMLMSVFQFSNFAFLHFPIFTGV